MPTAWSADLPLEAPGRIESRLRILRYRSDRPIKHPPPARGLDSVEASKMITLLDGYLVNHFDDFAAYDQKVKQGRLGRTFAEHWKETKKNLEKLSGSLREIPGLGIWSKTQTTSRGFSFALTAIGLIVLFSQPFFQSARFYVGLVIFYGGLILLAISWYAGWRLSKDLQRYFDAHPQKYRFAREYVKERAQELISALRQHMRNEGLGESAVRLELFNVDYRGIVAQKRSRLSRRHVVSLDLSAG